MTEIVLEGLEFYAYHGFYKQEQEIGNKYSIDLKVYSTIDPLNDELPQTIDYEKLYKIVKVEMGKKFKLLETIGNNVAERILNEFTSVQKVRVSVSKYNPPLGGICERAKVIIKKSR